MRRTDPVLRTPFPMSDVPEPLSRWKGWQIHGVELNWQSPDAFVEDEPGCIPAAGPMPGYLCGCTLKCFAYSWDDAQYPAMVEELDVELGPLYPGQRVTGKARVTSISVEREPGKTSATFVFEFMTEGKLT